MDVGSWEVVKGLMSWVVYPAMMLLGYLFKTQSTDIQMLKTEVAALKIALAVATSQIHDIREDIRDLTSAIKHAEITITEDFRILRKELLSK